MLRKPITTMRDALNDGLALAFVDLTPHFNMGTSTGRNGPAYCCRLSLSRLALVGAVRLRVARTQRCRRAERAVSVLEREFPNIFEFAQRHACELVFMKAETVTTSPTEGR